jgi:DNA polymerase-3 subunit beta
MRFTVERDVLAEAVAWVARSLPSRPVLPVLSGLLLEASPGGLTLSCFDYEVSARILVDAKVDDAGTALVPGRLLAEITRSLPPFPVGFDHLGDDVTLSCGAASFTLVTLPSGEYPRPPELPRLAGTADGAALATAIGQVTPAASRDDTLPVITGVNVEIDGAVLRLVATDRYRLAVRELGWQPARAAIRGELLVPARTLAEAARMMASGEAVRIMLSGEEEAGRVGPERRADAVIGFECGGRRLTTRLIGTEYIKYSSRFPRDFSSCADMPAVQLAEAVRRVALVAERGSSVRLSFAEAAVTIEAGTRGQARARETVAARFSGDESVIAFSPQYLLDGIGAALTAATHAVTAEAAQAGAAEAGAAEAGAAEAGAAEAGAAGAGTTAGEAPGQQPPADQARIRLQFTSPTKPALITGSPHLRGPAKEAGEPAPDFRYLVVPLRTLTDA